MKKQLKFLKSDGFFKWLSHTENECSVCGVWSILTVAFFEKYGSPVWICDRCAADLCECEEEIF